mmetsp:Transcript_39326/g.116536  ORF Transcript_39326/g.116536 Transcript_39326/m.116536 type:complete len:344 (+) Transcript_39326:1280-2311(+)
MRSSSIFLFRSIFSRSCHEIFCSTTVKRLATLLPAPSVSFTSPEKAFCTSPLVEDFTTSAWFTVAWPMTELPQQSWKTRSSPFTYLSMCIICWNCTLPPTALAASDLAPKRARWQTAVTVQKTALSPMPTDRSVTRWRLTVSGHRSGTTICTLTSSWDSPPRQPRRGMWPSKPPSLSKSRASRVALPRMSASNPTSWSMTLNSSRSPGMYSLMLCSSPQTGSRVTRQTFVLHFVSGFPRSWATQKLSGFPAQARSLLAPRNLTLRMEPGSETDGFGLGAGGRTSTRTWTRGTLSLFFGSILRLPSKPPSQSKYLGASATYPRTSFSSLPSPLKTMNATLSPGL